MSDQTPKCKHGVAVYARCLNCEASGGNGIISAGRALADAAIRVGDPEPRVDSVEPPASQRCCGAVVPAHDPGCYRYRPASQEGPSEGALERLTEDLHAGIHPDPELASFRKRGGDVPGGGAVSETTERPLTITDLEAAQAFLHRGALSQETATATGVTYVRLVRQLTAALQENERLAGDRDHWKITADAHAKILMAAQDAAGTHEDVDDLVRRLLSERDSARMDGVAAVTSIRCLKHFRVPPMPEFMTENEGRGECAACVQVDGDHEWALWYEKWTATLDTYSSLVASLESQLASGAEELKQERSLSERLDALAEKFSRDEVSARTALAAEKERGDRLAGLLAEVAITFRNYYAQAISRAAVETMLERMTAALSGDTPTTKEE